jgi:hypothetical protein
MKRRRPKKFLKFMWGQQQQQQKKSFFEAIQMTAKRTQMHCAKEVPPHPKRSERYLCTYLKGTTTTAKIHVMIFSW